MLTANKIPVPDPIAPNKSAETERAPTNKPPRAAATGMIRFSSLYIEPSRCPRMISCWSFNCLATSLGADPDTSIHVLERRALVPRTKIT